MRRRNSSTIPPIDQRAIEIQVASAFHRVTAEHVGADVADEILARVVESLADGAAANLASGDALGLSDLWEVWQDLGGDGRLDLHLDKLDDRVLEFHVDRCAYAELYQLLGIPKLGVAFSCHRDRPFAEALIPGVHVQQSQTILEGSSRCEFTYTLEDR